MDLVCLVFRATSYHSRRRYAVFAARVYQPCNDGRRSQLVMPGNTLVQYSFLEESIVLPFFRARVCVCPVRSEVRSYVMIHGLSLLYIVNDGDQRYCTREPIYLHVH